MRKKNKVKRRKEIKKEKWLKINTVSIWKSFANFIVIPAMVLLFLFVNSLPAQRIAPAPDNHYSEQAIKNQSYFYNVDREVTIEGQIEDFKFESRYEGKGYFLILMVKDKNSGQVLEVETAPASFFNIDIHKGEKIRLVGSIAEDQKQNKKLVLAREIKINNQTIVLRDRRGFPTWGQQGRKKGPTG
ncbi:MAG: hypothetical protein ACPLZD_09230 [Candidatus Saccharicenans sp.]|nr:MAG: hypothetical protein C0168_01445 [Candidatus Aminicenantes bacterium]